jgi:hypothetical protein
VINNNFVFFYETTKILFQILMPGFVGCKLESPNHIQSSKQLQMNNKKQGISQASVSGKKIDDRLFRHGVNIDRLEDDKDLFSFFNWSKGLQNLDQIEFEREKFEKDSRRFSLVKKNIIRGNEVAALFKTEETTSYLGVEEQKNLREINVKCSNQHSRSKPLAHGAISEFHYLDNCPNLKGKHQSHRRGLSQSNVQGSFLSNESLLIMGENCSDLHNLSSYFLRKTYNDDNNCLSNSPLKEESKSKDLSHNGTKNNSESIPICTGSLYTPEDTLSFPSLVDCIPRRRSSISEGCNIRLSRTEIVSQELKPLKHRGEQKIAKDSTNKHRKIGRDRIASIKSHKQRHLSHREVPNRRETGLGRSEMQTSHSYRVPRRRSSFSVGCHTSTGIEFEDVACKFFETKIDQKSPGANVTGRKGSKRVGSPKCDRSPKIYTSNPRKDVVDRGLSSSMSLKTRIKESYGNGNRSNLVVQTTPQSSRNPTCRRRSSSFSEGCENFPVIFESVNCPKTGLNGMYTVARFNNEFGPAASCRVFERQLPNVGETSLEEKTIDLLAKETLQGIQKDRLRHNHSLVKVAKVIGCVGEKLGIDESRSRCNKEDQPNRSRRHRTISPKRTS